MGFVTRTLQVQMTTISNICPAMASLVKTLLGNGSNPPLDFHILFAGARTKHKRLHYDLIYHQRQFLRPDKTKRGPNHSSSRSIFPMGCPILLLHSKIWEMEESTLTKMKVSFAGSLIKKTMRVGTAPVVSQPTAQKKARENL